MELQTPYNISRLADAESAQQHQLPEEESQHVEFASGEACEGHQPRHHFQRPVHDGGNANAKKPDTTQRALSVASEAVASASERSSEAVSRDLQLREISTAETMRTSRKPSPSPNRTGFGNAARWQSTQTQSGGQVHGEDLLREVLRRVQCIEDAIVGQRQGQGLGRYERLRGQELREDGDGDGDGIENDRTARS